MTVILKPILTFLFKRKLFSTKEFYLYANYLEQLKNSKCQLNSCEELNIGIFRPRPPGLRT